MFNWTMLSLFSGTIFNNSLTNGNNTVSVWPAITGTVSTPTAFTVQKPVMKTTNAALGNISQSISANGNQVFNGALSAGNSALNYGIIFADGDQTTTMGIAEPRLFKYRAELQETAFVGNQFVIQNGGFFNTLILYANSTVGVRELTNSQTGKYSY